MSVTYDDTDRTSRSVRPRRLRRGDPLLAALAGAAVAWLILLGALTGGLAGPSTSLRPAARRARRRRRRAARPRPEPRPRRFFAAIERGGGADVTVRVPGGPPPTPPPTSAISPPRSASHASSWSGRGPSPPPAPRPSDYLARGSSARAPRCRPAWRSRAADTRTARLRASRNERERRGRRRPAGIASGGRCPRSARPFCPRWVFRLPGGAPPTASCAATAAGPRTASSTSTRSRAVVRVRSSARTRSSSAPRGRPRDARRRRSRGCASPSASTRTTAPSRPLPRDRFIGRAVRAPVPRILRRPTRSRRSLGDHRAAHRARARSGSSGGSSPRSAGAARHRPARPPDPSGRRRGAPRACSPSTSRGPRDRLRQRGSGGRRRGRRPARRDHEAAGGACAQSRASAVDDRDARAAGPGPLRPVPAAESATSSSSAAC